MIYKLNLTTKNSELLDVFEIDTSEKNWDTAPSKMLTINEIFDEIYSDLDETDNN